MIMGVTGKNASGKDVFADYLIKKGFVHYSLSDILREELKKEGKESTRENLIAKGNALREKFGAGILAKRVAEKIKKSKNYIITSIRSPGEINELRKLEGFILIALEAPVELRFKREFERKKETAVKSIKEFKELEEKELRGNENSQQLLKCIEMADETIINGSSLNDFYNKIEGVLTRGNF